MYVSIPYLHVSVDWGSCYFCSGDDASERFFYPALTFQALCLSFVECDFVGFFVMIWLAFSTRALCRRAQKRGLFKQTLAWMRTL